MEVGEQISPHQADVGQQTTSPLRTDAGQQTSPPQPRNRPQSNPQQPPDDGSRQSVSLQSDSKPGVKPDSIVSTTTAATATATTATSTTSPKKFSRERVKSPVHRDIARLRMNSPKTSTGDLSLEFEMKAAGFEVTDSYDSSECVGFMSDDANLDDTLHEQDSNLSLETLGSGRHERQISTDDESLLRVGERTGGEEREAQDSSGVGKPGREEGMRADVAEGEEALEKGVSLGETRLTQVEVKTEERHEPPLARLKEETAAVEARGEDDGERAEPEREKRMSLEELAMDESSDSDLPSSASSEGDLPGLKKGTCMGWLKFSSCRGRCTQR